MAYSLTSVCISNGCFKSGNAKTRAELIFCFKASNSFFYFPPHQKTNFTVVKACSGAAMEEKLAINFLHYFTAPRKLLTFVTDLGIGQFIMIETLEGSIFNSPPPTMWPKYTKQVFPNSPLDIFRDNYSFLMISKNFLTCLTCSSHDFLKIKYHLTRQLQTHQEMVLKHHS